MYELIFNDNQWVADPKDSSFIYCWENTLNHKKYVGQTSQGKRRLYNEKSEVNVYGAFKNALHKYGIHNFICYILEYCSVEDLDSREIYWIQKLNSHYSQEGYNLTWGGQNPFQYLLFSVQTEQYYKTYEEIPESEYDYIYQYDIQNNQITEKVRPFYAFDMTGEQKGKFLSLKHATSFCNKPQEPQYWDNIRKCLNQTSKSAYGYFWSFDIEPIIPQRNNHRRIAKYSLDGKLIEVFPTMVAAADSVGCSNKDLWGVLHRKECKQLKGFMWRIVEGEVEEEILPYLRQIPYTIQQFDLQDNFLNEYPSIVIASEKSGDSVARISAVCNCHASNTRKYKWKKHINERN